MATVNQCILLLFLSLFAMETIEGARNKNTAVTAAALPSNKRIVCYYSNWAAYRPGSAKFLPQNINPHLCTHLIYAFGGFTNDFQLRPFDKWQDIDQGGYAKFNGLKAHNKNLKTLLAIGGWNEGSQRFSKLVADPEARQNLVKSAIKYLRQHNFDGLDLDWEYPASREGSKDADRTNYAHLVKELREGFNKEKTNRDKLLLTMAVPAGIDTIEKGYDIRALNRDLDFLNILSYDYHSSFEPQVNHHAPLLARTLESGEFDANEELNVDATVQVYLLNGASADKLVVGIPTYGRAYKLITSDQTELGSPAEGPAEPGKATREKGYLAYYEICEKVNSDGWLVEKPDPDAIGPFATNGQEWVGYDDEEMASRKGKYVADNNLGGIMFWSIDNDDFRGECTGRKYPLIESAKAGLFGIELPEVTQHAEIETSVEQDSTKSTTPSTALIRPSSSQRRKESGSVKSETRSTTARSSGNFNPFTTPAPPTTPESLVDFTCKDEGFFPNPKDCKKYFWCLESGAAGLVQHVFTCPSGLHFNKFTDSCDYATNVGCTIGAATSTTTTTTTTAKPKVTSRTTKSRPTTRTTTPEPEEEDIEEDEEEEEKPVLSVKKIAGGEDDPEELQQLLQLISDLGGVDAVKKLLERKAGRGRTKDGQQIRLTQAQRQALEKVIKPTTSKTKQKAPEEEEDEAPVTTKRPNRLQHTLLNRSRNQSARNQNADSERPTALSQGSTRRPLIVTSTTTTTEGSAPLDFEDPPVSQEELFDEEEDDDEAFHSEPSTTQRTTTTRATTTSTTTTEAPTTQKRVVATRRRPLNSNQRSTTSAPVVVRTEAPRAPIVIAIPASVVRPGAGDEVKRRPANSKPPAAIDQDDIDGSAEVIQVGHNSNGNVVEIDEDGRVFCYDVGNFAYPDDCRKFVQCARSGGSGPIQGWVQTCPRILSFDPVGAICNWGSPVRCRQS